MLRATNTGATAVVDHRGVVMAQLAPFQRGVLRAEAEGRDGLTPFARWAGWAGLWPLWIAGVLLALPAVVARAHAHRRVGRRSAASPPSDGSGA
jgi:apolipoprotein N-acyltransferase